MPKKKLVYLLCLLGFLTSLIAQPSLSPKEQKQLQQWQKKIQQTTHQVLPACVSLGAGAGVIITPKGHVLTNYHIVEDIKEWQIHTQTGHSFYAKVIGIDKQGDLALLKINSNKTFPSVPLGNSDHSQVTDWVIAVGNPFLYAQRNEKLSVSLGTISAVHCFQDNYRDSIQTDVSLNPGNSGGPLFNLKGQLIGINGRIASRFANRQNSGVGYAISSKQIANFLPYLKRGLKAYHGTIPGVTYGQTSSPSVIITKVDPKYAKEIPLQPKDVIIKVDDFSVSNIYQFLGRLWIYPAYAKVTLTIVREGQEKFVEVMLQP